MAVVEEAMAEALGPHPTDLASYRRRMRQLGTCPRYQHSLWLLTALLHWVPTQSCVRALHSPYPSCLDTIHHTHCGLTQPSTCLPILFPS